MNIADAMVIMSLFLTLVPLIIAIIAKKSNNEMVYGDGEVWAWLCLFAGVVFIHDQNLKNSFWFGFIAGTMMQPLLADPYLTRRTLVYGDYRKHLHIARTPYWVALLWGIALTQLSYLWMRLNGKPDFGPKYFLFILIGFVYFYIFEFLVNNYTYWWERKNCQQPFKVALYASQAELFTVVTIPITMNAIRINGIFWPSFITGIFVAIYFIWSCYTYYTIYGWPKEKN